MVLLLLHVIVLVVLIVVNMLACVPTTLQPLMSTKLVEFCYQFEIWATFRCYVMVKGGDWGYIQPIFILHLCYIYIYINCLSTFICCGCAYGCVPTTLRPPLRSWASLWNFATNLGKSQRICDGEMRWLRLLTQPIFISHQCYIYIRCLTTFICCGCAYGCVPTTLWPLMPTKLKEFC